MGTDGSGSDSGKLRAQLKELGPGNRDYLKMMTSILDNDIVGIAVLDAKGIYLLFNRGAERLTGYDRAEIIGTQAPGTIFRPEDREAMQNSLGSADPINNREITIRRKDGSEKDLILSMSPGVGEPGENNHYLQIFLDNSEKKHLAELLLHSQKMETIGEMAGGIAHDFNNLLEGILGYTTFMKDLVTPGHELRSYLEIIERSARKAADLTERLLTLSKGYERDENLVNCNVLLRDVAKLLEKTVDKKISLEFNLKKDLKAVKGAAGQIEQAFLNICMNARDAMPDGGKLVISSDNVVVDDTYPKMSLKMRTGEYVRISISDTGIGMDAETMNRIFEPFFTTKRRGEGTGLGLNMVYGIVDSHGGFINVYSEVGQGTTFNIYLRAEGAEAPEEEWTREQVEAPRGNGETVLVIDDEPMIIDIGREMLNKLGYEVITAGEAELGLQYFKDRQDEIDIVLLDIIMPGANGKEILREIRMIKPWVPVILSSGYDRSVLDDDFSGDGNIYFMQKPYSMEDLGRNIHASLHGSDDQ